MTEGVLLRTGSADETFGLPVVPEVMFTDHKGVEKKSLKKKQLELLRKITFVKPFLHDNEKILLVSSACSPMTFLEQYLMGWMVIYIKRCLLIITDQRILHVPTKPNFAYRHSLLQIRYPDCAKLEMSFQKLKCQYGNGKKEVFYYISVPRKKMQQVLDQYAGEAAENPQGQRTPICPQCHSELERGIYECPKCFLKFKNKAEGRRISWIFPGGGYFYVGRPFLGVGDAITEVILIVLVLTALSEALTGVEGGVVGLVILTVILILEKLATVYETHHFIDDCIPQGEVAVADVQD